MNDYNIINDFCKSYNKLKLLNNKNRHFLNKICDFCIENNNGNIILAIQIKKY